MATPRRGSVAYTRQSIKQLLGEEGTGEKFARLTKRDSDAAIEAIHRDGIAAGRARILELDRVRRVVRTRRERAQRYAGLGKVQRSAQWDAYRANADAEFWSLYKSFVA